MPELPDVESFRKYLAVTSLHKKIVKVHIPGKELLAGISSTTLRRHLKGRKLVNTSRHGKHLFAETDAEEWLMLHFGMTGKLKYYGKDDRKPSHTRLLLDFENGYHLAYDNRRKLGSIGLVKDIEGFVRRRELGEDALEVDLETFREIYESKRGSVKAAIMDQKTMAGVGNIYADEILFQAKIDPEMSLGELDRNDIGRLFRNMKKVLKKAIDCRADPDCLPSSYIIPHRQKDGKCPRCGNRLEKVKVSGRTTYYCPCRQKA